VLYTGTEAVVGLIVGVALGTAAGLATARWASARDVLLPVAIGASTIPIIAFAPITLNWFGPESLLPRITIVALMVFFPVMVNTVRGLTNVEPAALELMTSYAASESQMLAKLRAPNALPYWFTALRIATTLSVIGAVVGEFFGGPLYALGIYITLETGNSRYATAWAAIILACGLGIGLYLAAVALERLVMPWRSAREIAR
jgi:NitT/TauT family transport system permease protein